MTELPRGWVETTLGELGFWQGGGTPDKSNTAYWSSGTIPWISPKDMKRFHISEAEDQITEAALAGSSANLIPQNSVLLVSRSGILKHTLPVALTGRDVAINQDIKALTPHRTLDPRFIAQHIKSLGPFVLKNCTKAGTTVDSVDFERLKSVPANIAPLNEQKRIVAKLDALNAKSARARTELARVETLVSRYRQAMLSKAFSGELTNGDTATDWPTVKLEEIAEVGTGATPKRGNTEYYSNGTIPWVTSGAVNQGLIRQADEFITERALQETNCKVFPAGTLVVAMYGEGKTRGKVAVLGLNAATNQALAAVQIRRSEVSAPQYVYLFLQSVYLTLREEAAGGVQPNLNLSMVKAIELPLPPLREQHEIVRRIESTFAKIDGLAKEAKRALELVGRLDEAILAKAFRGELVPQDEHDEPADRLLARIRAEREKAPKGKQSQRRGSTSEKAIQYRGASAMNKSRQDVGPNHLAGLLKTAGGRKQASDLWLQSGMDLDEFYKQLRTEIDLGQIAEGAEKGELVLANEN